MRNPRQFAADLIRRADPEVLNRMGGFMTHGRDPRWVEAKSEVRKHLEAFLEDPNQENREALIEALSLYQKKITTRDKADE